MKTLLLSITLLLVSVVAIADDCGCGPQPQYWGENNAIPVYSDGKDFLAWKSPAHATRGGKTCKYILISKGKIQVDIEPFPDGNENRYLTVVDTPGFEETEGTFVVPGNPWDRYMIRIIAAAPAGTIEGITGWVKGIRILTCT